MKPLTLFCVKKRKFVAQSLGILLVTGCSPTIAPIHLPTSSASQTSALKSAEQSIESRPPRSASQILTPQDIAAFDLEYTGFKTLALTQDYLLKKIQRWIGLNDGVRLVRELEYGRLKYPSTLGDLYNANPSLKTTTANCPEVIMARSQNADFEAFVAPLFATAAALSITNLQASAGIGEQVTLQGFHFSSVSSVTIQGVSANFSVANDTQMSVQIPASATSGNLVLTAGSETASQALSISNRVWFVNPAATGTGDGSSWANAYPDLQTALADVSAAGGSDQIWIAAGTYKPSSSGNREAYFNVPANTSVYGGFAGTESYATDRNLTSNQTILSGDLNGNDSYTPSLDINQMWPDNSFNLLRHGNNASLDGLTIQGGYSDGMVQSHPDIPNGAGPGIYSDTNTLKFMNNCVIRHNYSSNMAGAWYYGGGNTSISNTTFESNYGEGTGGGAIYNETASLTFDHVNFTGNNANGGGGGGVYNAGNGALSLTQTTFTGNHADGAGGAGIFNVGNGNITLSQVDFSNNSANGGGGAGVYNQGNGNLTLSQTNFTGNQADGNGGSGIYNAGSGNVSYSTGTLSNNRAGGGQGAVTNNSGTVTLIDLTFTGNSADGAGGAGVYTNTGPVTISNSSFSNGSAYGGGGSAIYSAAADLNISNITFTNNTGNSGPVHNNGTSSTTTVNSSTFTNNSAFGYGGGGIYTQGNLNVSTSTFDGNQGTGSGGSAIDIASGGTAVLNNLTFSNNQATGGGGAILLESGGHLTGTQLQFLNNVHPTDSAPQGISAWNSVSPPTIVLDTCTFDGNGNTSSQGGAIQMIGGTLQVSNSTFTNGFGDVGGVMQLSNVNTQISNTTMSNTNVGGGGTVGGAVYQSGGSLSIMNGTFSNNRADNYGGGAICTSNLSSLTLDTVSFNNNSSNEGGAVYASLNTSTTLNRVKFVNNSTVGFGGALNLSGAGSLTVTDSSAIGNQSLGGGGAFSLSNPQGATLNNVVFANNSVTSASPGYGGAIYSSGGPLTLNHVTIGENTAAGEGDAIYAEASAPVTLRNSLIWDSGAAPIFLNGGTLSSLYSVLKGLSGYSLQSGSTGNVDADPLFSNAADPDGADNIPGTADDGLALQTGSPALNLDTSGAGPLALDILGLARVGNPDAGAYEKQ